MKHLYSTIITCLLAGGIYAQYCTPAANCSDNDFIDNFSFNTIVNNGSGGSNCSTGSYINTGLSTNVVQGQSYSISMQSGPAWPEGFGVWIDYNQNNDFNDAGEFVYASPSAATTPFTGSITIPVSAAVGSTRMRVRCRYSQTIAAGESCTSFNFGESEDYTVNIQSASIPPVADFTASPLLTCNGLVDFFDNSTGGTPSSWLWYFGDGDSSTVQNPSHTYLSNGTYTVTLIACNAYGCDTLIQSNLITVNSGGPIAPSCIPATLAWCCGFGITEVQFNTINQLSSDGSAGYEDMSCAQTYVLEGQSYPIFIRTDNPAEHNVKVWIDFDNDGTFNPVTEEVLSANQVLTVNGSIAIPTGAVLNTPLRMRISADFWQNPAPTPCSDLNVGQAEDYGVIILPNNNPPVSDFTVSDTLSCTGSVCFTDQSQNTPTFWYWQFGDGNTSTLPNPCHTYAQDSTYTVTLITSNANGSDTVIMPNLVTVNLPGGLTPTCPVTTQAYLPDYGIYSVQFDNPAQFLNVTNGGSDGYMDYSCLYTANVIESNSYYVEIRTGLSNPEDVNIWIDFNNNGDLSDPGELVFTSLNNTIHSGMINIPVGAVLNTPLRMRINSDFVGSGNGPCDNSLWSQVEDYGIVIGQNPAPPVADFYADTTTSCTGIINFFDNTSGGSPTSWFWDFGDGNTDTVANPSHTYTVMGNYDVTLIVTNIWGTDSITFTAYIDYDTIYCNATIMPVTGVGSTQTNCSGTLFDNGGPNGNYANNSNSYIVIAPSGATQLTLDFTQFDLELNWDFVYVYDGPSVASPVLATLTGNTLPPQLQTSGGSATVQLVSDPVISKAGFAMLWQCSYLPVPPTAYFAADSTVDCDGVVSFTDNSNGQPTSWYWDFGDGGFSSQQNPTYIYSNPGSYTVTLIVTNAQGSDTLVLPNFITYDPNACAVYNMPLTGTSTFTTCGGTLYDDGGAVFNYSNNADGIAVIAPTGATQLTLTFNQFQLANFGDTLFIHDGFNTGAPLIGFWTGTINPGVITTTGGAATIHFVSNQNFTTAGFEMSWACSTAPSAPLAFFTADSVYDCDGAIGFQDISTGSPTSWYWDFGDGNNDTVQNPTHIYTSTGTYTVLLTVSNAMGTDTFSITVVYDPGYCQVFSMPSTGTGTTITGCSGTIYDDGGSGNYTDNSNSILTVDPSSGDEVRLTFTDFTFEQNFDYLEIWDGPDTLIANSTLIGKYDGTSLPNGGVITSTNGALTLHQYSDFSINMSGFVATISCVTGLDDTPSKDALLVYPNPSRDIINIICPMKGSGMVTIELRDVPGKLVYSREATYSGRLNEQIDLSRNAPGIYWLTIKNSQFTMMKQIIRN